MTQERKRERGAPTRSGCCGGIGDLVSPRLFRALGDPRRIALLARLAECTDSCTVSEIAKCCPVDLSVVSRHLALLREVGVVEAIRQGREVRYRLCAASLVRALRAIADALEACCPPGATGGGGETGGPRPRGGPKATGRAKETRKERGR